MAEIGYGNVGDVLESEGSPNIPEWKESNGSGKLLRTNPLINRQTGTSYTLQASDNGKVIECENGAETTITIPTSLGAGFNCVITQLGAGQVVLVASSTTLRNRNGLKIAGQYGVASVLPTNTANTYLIGGDMTA